MERDLSIIENKDMLERVVEVDEGEGEELMFD